jgi:hypothetical protein
MALAHQANAQKVKPDMLGVVGASGVGKTVYLGMLMDMLSRRTMTAQRMHMLARGAFSLTLQQTAIAALSQREFPAKTPNEPERWHWLHSQLSMVGRKKPLELIMPDMSGEALMEEVNRPFTYRGVRSFLSKCSGLLVLVDAAAMMRGSREQDYYSMKLLNYLCELDDDPKHGWPNSPLAIVLTKADECESAFENPAAFVQHHAAGLHQLLHERFRKFDFFAVGVAGACATRYVRGQGCIPVPLRIEPRNIVEPFEWMVKHL